MKFRNGMRPVHPGEIPREHYLPPLGMSADTALRLARYFGGDAQSWLNLQTAYDLRVAELEGGARVRKEVVVRAKAA